MNDTERLEARLEQLEAQLGKLQDKEAINAVIMRYTRALDWLDTSLLEDVFFDDADIDYGFFKGSGKDFRGVVMDVERSVGRRWHFPSPISVDLHGDQAYVTSYGISMAAEPVEASPPAEWSTFYGHYFDHFEKRDGVWNIASRKYSLLTGSGFKEVEPVGFLAVLNAIGVTGPDRPEYRSFL